MSRTLNSSSDLFVNADLFEYRQENAILKNNLRGKEKELWDLKSKMSALESESQSLVSSHQAFLQEWAELMSNLKHISESYIPPSSESELSIFDIIEEQSHPEVISLTDSIIRKLLKALELAQGSPTEDIQQQNIHLKESYVKATSQINSNLKKVSSIKAEIQEKDKKIASLNSQIASFDKEVAELQSKAIQNEMAAKCKCLCICGSRKAMGKDSSEVKHLQAERDHYKSMHEQASQQATKLKMELEVSEERFIHTKAFKKILADSRKLANQVEQLNIKNEELEKYKNKSSVHAKREVEKAIEAENHKIKQLKNEIEILKSRCYDVETLKNQSEHQMHLMREELSKRKNPHKDLEIHRLEQENGRVREQVVKLKRQNAELEKRIEDLQNKTMELRDFLFAKDLELDKFKDKLPALEESEVEELHRSMKEKDRKISKMEEYNRNKKLELNRELVAKESLMFDYEVLERAYDESVKLSKDLKSQLLEAEEKNIQLMQERAKEERTKTLQANEQSSFEETLNAKDILILSLREEIDQYQVDKQEQEKQVSVLQNHLKKMENHVKNFLKNSLTAQEFNESKKEMSLKVKKAEALCVKHATETAQIKFYLQQSQAKVKDLEEDLKYCRFKATPHEIVSAEVNRYRKMLKCSLCKSRIKDCVLIQCFHAFCSKCIEHIITERNKKCPHCLVRFTTEEVKALDWTK